jgi:hypothetical protein
VGELKAPDKPFDVSKRAVWEAYEKVRANKGAPGVDKEDYAKPLTVENPSALLQEIPGHRRHAASNARQRPLRSIQRR